MRFALVATIAFLISAPSLLALDDIPPPFGFHWKDSMTRVEAVLKGQKRKLSRGRKKKIATSGPWRNLCSRALSALFSISGRECSLRWNCNTNIRIGDRTLQRPDGRNSPLLRCEVRDRQISFAFPRHGDRRDSNTRRLSMDGRRTRCWNFSIFPRNATRSSSEPSRWITN